MIAVIATGGKQYTVTPGQVIKLEKLEHNIGDQIELEKVLLITHPDGHVEIGAPFLDGSKVLAEVTDQARHKKVNIIKMRRRKHYMRRQGHRQYFTEVKIIQIVSSN